MKCADCGATLEEGSDLCLECGSPVATKPKPAPVGSYGAAASTAPVKKSTFDDLIAEALESVEEVEQAAVPPAPDPAPAPGGLKTAPPKAATTPRRARPADDEEQKVRCPACGVPSTKTRCGSCGVILRHDE